MQWLFRNITIGKISSSTQLLILFKMLGKIPTLFGSFGKHKICCFAFIKDTISDKPKYLKEYLNFLNDALPFTFMKKDNNINNATSNKKHRPKSVLSLF